MPVEVVLRLPASARPPRMEDERELVRAAARALRRPPESLAAVRPTRLSLDARRGRRGWRLALMAWERGEAVPAPPPLRPPAIAPPAPGAPHVAIVGSGPAGLFAALDLLAAGVRVSVLERGRDARARRRSIRAPNRGQPVEPDSNYCFGEGGAGTYSDGKLYARSGKREAVRGVLETLVAHGAPSAILWDWRPHVGSNRLPGVVTALRETIRSAGGAVRFRLRAEALETSGAPPRVTAVLARDLASGARERIACDALVLAAGHSALDALEMARAAGARLEAKGFAMGVRAEHPQPWLDARQYGGRREACELPAAFYELVAQEDGRGVYSFCMCPGGFIVPATTEDGRVVVNGMSLARRDSPFANSGIVVALEPGDWCGAEGERQGWSELLARAEGRPIELPRVPADDPLFGTRLQRALESLAWRAAGGAHRAPAQTVGRFVEGGPSERVLPTSYRPGLTPVALAGLLPRGMAERLRAALLAFEPRLPGFATDLGQLVGVETRTSSPVRIVRDPETCVAAGTANLCPAGEGAGYAGGIVSAALDGRRVAAALCTLLAR